MNYFTHIFITLILCTPLCATTWESLLAQHKAVIGDEARKLLTKQYHAFITHEAPPIADARIKSIPIVECHEPLVDLRALNHARIRVMEGENLQKAHHCPEDIDPRATKHGYMRSSVFDALVRTITILDELALSFGYEAGELEIHLFEGLRDIATQKQLFDTLLDNIKRENPQLSHEEAYAQTSKFVSPYINNVPVHSTGAAIDIHLWSNKKQDYCHMGRFNSSKDGAPTFSENISEQQKLHRLLLLVTATRAGLTNYVYEFWHFSYGDRYACYWRGQDHALYGSV